MINIGDYVTRKSHNSDMIFEVVSIKDNVCIIKGVDFRLIADSPVEDLIPFDRSQKREVFCPSINDNLDRSEYFYLPGKILHIDSDKSYLERCLEFYKNNKVPAFGKCIKESEMAKYVGELLNKYNPDILVLTGHDAYYKKRVKESNKLYKNSENFCTAVRKAREKRKDKLIIFAGACQSNFEELIKSGATFASSPGRINIHALDPAIIATSLSLYDRNKEVNLLELLSKTKYGKEGIGGLKSNGTMYIGYPRESK